jgi:predicted kinase
MTAQTSTDSTPGSDRWLWLMGMFITMAIVVVAALAVVLMGDRQDAALEPGSPEAVVQDYAEAWAAGDSDAGWQMLTPRAQARVQQYEFREAIRWDEGRTDPGMGRRASRL